MCDLAALRRSGFFIFTFDERDETTFQTFVRFQMRSFFRHKKIYYLPSMIANQLYRLIWKKISFSLSSFFFFYTLSQFTKTTLYSFRDKSFDMTPAIDRTLSHSNQSLSNSSVNSCRDNVTTKPQLLLTISISVFFSI